MLGALVVLALIPVFTRPGPLRVNTTMVERGPIRSLISTNGKIEPIRNFEAHSPVPTTVKRLYVKEGDHVRKGQLLLQLDDADLLSQAARAQAQIKAAQAGQAEVTTGGTREEVPHARFAAHQRTQYGRLRPAQSAGIAPFRTGRRRFAGRGEAVGR